MSSVSTAPVRLWGSSMCTNELIVLRRMSALSLPSWAWFRQRRDPQYDGRLAILRLQLDFSRITVLDPKHARGFRSLQWGRARGAADVRAGDRAATDGAIGLQWRDAESITGSICASNCSASSGQESPTPRCSWCQLKRVAANFGSRCPRWRSTRSGRKPDASFRALLKDAQLPAIRFHDRGTRAPRCFSRRALARVQEVLCPSEIRVTLGTYGHVMPASGLEAAHQWNDYLG